MTYNKFRELQRAMDDMGILSSIQRTGQNKNRRYEVIVNGEVIKKYKTRRSAKKCIVARYIKVLSAV